MNNNSITRYAKGPQFQIQGGVFLFFLLMVFLVIAIVNIVFANYFLAVFFLLSSSLLFLYIINIRGFEIDTKSGQIKEYKKFLWMRIGKWEKLKNYTCICLTKGKLNIPRSVYSGYSVDTYFYYFVKLVNEVNKKELVLFSHQEYFLAKEFLDQISKLIKLEVKIKIKTLKNI